MSEGVGLAHSQCGVPGLLGQAGEEEEAKVSGAG